MRADRGMLVPGSKITSGLRKASPGALAFNVLDNRTDRWGPIRLPLRWPRSSCFLYINRVVDAAQFVRPAGTAEVIWPIPASPLVGLLRRDRPACSRGTCAGRGAG